MQPIYKKIYDLNKHEAKLIRGIIRLAMDRIIKIEQVHKNSFKNKLSDIEWVEYPSIFKNSDYRLSFNFNDVLVSCIVRGYAVADICKGNNVLSNGEYIRTASLTLNQYRSEKPVLSLFERRVFINFTLEYDTNISHITESKLDVSKLQLHNIFCKREAY